MEINQRVGRKLFLLNVVRPPAYLLNIHRKRIDFAAKSGYTPTNSTLVGVTRKDKNGCAR